MTYTIEDDIKQQVFSLYKAGLSAQEIKDNLKLKHSVRQVQRWLQVAGMSRSVAESFRLAVAKGRLDYRKRKYTQKKCPHCGHILW